MPSLPNFGVVRAVSITIRVDHRADRLFKSSQNIKYFHEKPLLAEHGFAALLDINHGERRTLWMPASPWSPSSKTWDICKLTLAAFSSSPPATAPG